MQNEPTGDWWLEVGDDNKKIGFWPKRIFSSLSDLATRVDWGGEIFSPPDIPSPPMGSGNFPWESTEKDAFCAHIATINEAHQLVNAVGTGEEVNDDTYEPVDERQMSGSWGHLVFFGGPGGAKRK